MNDELDNNKLDSPLIVHKKSDASYQETASDISMDETHAEEEGPTLERHRFKKEKKKGKGVVIFAVIVVIAAVFVALYMTGNITFDNTTTTATKKTTTTQQETDLAELYANTIVVKNTYIFVDGEEVDGIEGLQKAIKYEDPSTTRYTIIDEGADSDFLNLEVLSLLTDMKFYDEKTNIKHVDSTGLMAQHELDALTTTTTTTEKQTTTKKATTKKDSQ